jgi:hypothetical protein
MFDGVKEERVIYYVSQHGVERYWVETLSYTICCNVGTNESPESHYRKQPITLSNHP